MIYLDRNATTPILLDVFAAMEPYFRDEWGNPSSSYRFGSKLKGVLETARAQVAEITDDTAVVSLMWANNDTGVPFPVTETAGLCRARGVLFGADNTADEFRDATAAVRRRVASLRGVR